MRRICDGGFGVEATFDVGFCCAAPIEWLRFRFAIDKNYNSVAVFQHAPTREFDRDWQRFSKPDFTKSRRSGSPNGNKWAGW